MTCCSKNSDKITHSTIKIPWMPVEGKSVQTTVKKCEQIEHSSELVNFKNVLIALQKLHYVCNDDYLCETMYR